jgi:hypothetical protein
VDKDTIKMVESLIKGKIMLMKVLPNTSFIEGYITACEDTIKQLEALRESIVG